MNESNKIVDIQSVEEFISIIWKYIEKTTDVKVRIHPSINFCLGAMGSILVDPKSGAMPNPLEVDVALNGPDEIFIIEKAGEPIFIGRLTSKTIFAE